MLICVYLLLLFELVAGQRQNFRGGNRYSPVPYYNISPKPGNGVGVLQDLSNARILSNEPFIISFEFPKLIGSGDNRKNRFGAKRTKSQRKKNRKPREFKHTAAPEDHILERRNRLQILRRSPGLENLKLPNLITHSGRMGKSFLKTEDDENPSDRTNYGRVLNFKTQTEETEEQNPVELENQAAVKVEEHDEKMESVHQKNWENIKKKWMSLFAKNKEGDDNEVKGENVMDEERIKAMSRKMWANCQLLKLLKAPQKNPYFYQLLPPNYPALIMNEEKQLECNQFYDVIDLAKDKKMIADKIDQLEKILSAGNDSGSRRKREAPAERMKTEEENTLQDETLQGKLEGEVRSDRSKRTKERQHIRKQRSKESSKGKVRRLHRNTIKNAPRKSERQEKDEVENVKRSRRKDGVSEEPAKKILEEADLKSEEDEKGKKREKQEIKAAKENNLQDVFSPTEVNKVIRQKEMEANIFDKVLRAMKKFEENNPYDESFRPQKRESGNDTEIVLPHNDPVEEGWELEDTIKKLAKIFKILGVKAEAAKRKAEQTEEDSSEELDAKGKVKKSKVGVGKTPKCTCAECPFCQDCYQCFKECRKAVLAAKNPAWNNQTPVSSAQVMAAKGSNSENNLTNGQGTDFAVTHEERSNNMKLERMYRSKLPPSRDLVRVYFDNPENKLLVWTKRGRRTMPWGPLTSDLQLYRDRARQILKSAEDILSRIRETEDKIHSGHYDENDQESHSDKTESVKDMDDIIKKVVNEDETKNILRTPWEAELEKGVLSGNVVKSNQIQKHFNEETNNIFKDTMRERTELPKESLTIEDVNVGDKQTDHSSTESYDMGRVEAVEPKDDIRNRAGSIKDEIEDDNVEEAMDNKSVEAAVLPIEKEKIMAEKINLFDPESAAHIKGFKDSPQGGEEKDEEDVPAKVEPVKPDRFTVEAAWKTTSKDKIKVDSHTNWKQTIEYKIYGKPGNVQAGSSESEEEKPTNEEPENVKKANFDESQSFEDEYDEKSESVEKAHNRKSGAEKANSEESEGEERATVGASAEREKSHSIESEDVEKALSEESAERKSYSAKSEDVEKALSEESAERKSYSAKSEDVGKTLSEESEERKSYSAESEEETGLSGESKEKEVSYTRESEDVEKAWSGESEEKEKSKGEESSTEEERGIKPQSEEKEKSAEIEGVKKVYGSGSEEVQRAFSTESEEADAITSAESGSGEKIRGRESELEDVERSAETTTGELRKLVKQGESKTVAAKKGWQQTEEMEKKAEQVIKELKMAVKLQKDEKGTADQRKGESDEVEKVEKSNFEKESSGEEISSYEDSEELERKETDLRESFDEEVEDTKEEQSPNPTVKERPEKVEGKPHEEENDFEGHIKSIEENYIMKGVKQTKQEKEAILKALLNVEEKEGVAEEAAQEIGEIKALKSGKEEEKEQATAEKGPVKTDGNVEDSLKTVVKHLESGHMDENDFDVIKKLDESQVDHIIGQIQKNDEKGTSVNCETRMKLCHAVCSCSSNNGTDSDLDKYKIIKGFLGWLKDLKMEKMVPISV